MRMIVVLFWWSLIILFSSVCCYRDYNYKHYYQEFVKTEDTLQSSSVLPDGNTRESVTADALKQPVLQQSSRGDSSLNDVAGELKRNAGVWGAVIVCLVAVCILFYCCYKFCARRRGDRAKRVIVIGNPVARNPPQAIPAQTGAQNRPILPPQYPVQQQYLQPPPRQQFHQVQQHPPYSTRNDYGSFHYQPPTAPPPYTA